MSVNKVSKSQLARLLATENLDVVHKQIPTAYFNVKSRELGLPIWDNATSHVYDLLVGHEVGHALFTPTNLADYYSEIDAENEGIVQSYINVVEDARIEKLMKRKYAGLSKSFFKGYSEMHTDNYFGTADRELTDYNLLDRINLHFKLGNYLSIPFSPEEKILVDRVATAETFDDVVSVVRDIYAKASQESETDNHHNPDDFDGESEPSDGSGIPNNSSDKEKSDGESDSDNESNGDDESEDAEECEYPASQHDRGGNRNTTPPASETESQFNDSVRENLNDENAQDKVYGKIPVLDSSEYVVDYKDVQHDLSEWISNGYDHIINETRLNFSKFKKEQTKAVNYMVKEFELKKNAKQYARAAESKTGVLDVTKIHSYKFNDDLFKKITVVPDGKNHGLVMFVDFSGSMERSIGPTIKQIINLVMFCKKVNIPFEVYSFTDSTGKPNYEIDSGDHRSYAHYGHDGELIVSHFAMRNYFSSRMKNSEFETAMFNMFFLAEIYISHGYWNVPETDSLGGTPLNDCIIVSFDLVEKFKRLNNLEKVNAVYLTDGESSSTDAVVESDSEGKKWSKSIRFRYYGYHGDAGDTVESWMVDPITKINYPLKSRLDVTDGLLNALQDRLGINVIGFFIAPQRRDLQSAFRISGFDKWQDREMLKKLSSKFNKDQSVILDSKGYSNFIVVKGGDDLDTETSELAIDSDMKKGAMTTAFKKHQKAKSFNRVVLNKFVELIS